MTRVPCPEFNKGFNISPEGLITGRIPGLLITSADGSPDAARTVTSLRSMSIRFPYSPLFIVDDVPVFNSAPDINPEDIESITYLNNGTAAIYGGQAAGGALLIKTKKGTSRLKLNYTGKVAISTIQNRYDVLDADEFRRLVNEYPGEEPLPQVFPGSADTDWQKEIYRAATGSDHHLSLSGTLNKVPYRLAVGETMMQGTIKTSSYRRSTIMASISPRLFDGHLMLNFNTRASLKSKRSPDGRVIYFAAAADPTIPVYNESGSGRDYTASDFFANPVAILDMTDNRLNSSQWSGNIMAEYRFHFLPQLSIMANYAAENYSDRLHNVTDTSATWYRYGYNLQDTVLVKNRTINARLDYSGTFDAIDSRLELTGGFFFNRSYSEHSTFETTLLHPEYYSSVYSDHTRSMISWFTRLNFSVMEKYSLSLTISKDKYSTADFDGKGIKDLSPSVFLIWNLKNEPFLADISAIDGLKLFFGSGSQKSLPMSIFAYDPRSSTVPAFSPDLTPERKSWHNLGLEFTFFNRRVSGNITAFQNTTSDMIIEVIVPSGMNFNNSILVNAGKVASKGLEISLKASLFSDHDLTWDLSFASSLQKNILNSLGENNSFINTGLINGTMGYYAQRDETGFPLNSYYLMQQVYNTDGRPLEGLFSDLNRDGTTNYEDRRHYHSSDPAATIGISSMIGWKNWELSLSGRAEIGNYLYNYENLNANYQTVMLYHRNVSPLIETSQFHSMYYYSDYFVENASFFRMDFISLGYNFKDLIKNKLSFKLSAIIENAFILTGYSGNDPEVQSGISYYTWPRPTTTSLTVSIGF
jgi:iron complex outermembrane receptor protein